MADTKKCCPRCDSIADAQQSLDYIENARAESRALRSKLLDRQDGFITRSLFTEAEWARLYEALDKLDFSLAERKVKVSQHLSDLKHPVMAKAAKDCPSPMVRGMADSIAKEIEGHIFKKASEGFLAPQRTFDNIKPLIIKARNTTSEQVREVAKAYHASLMEPWGKNDPLAAYRRPANPVREMLTETEHRIADATKDAMLECGCSTSKVCSRHGLKSKLDILDTNMRRVLRGISRKDLHRILVLFTDSLLGNKPAEGTVDFGVVNAFLQQTMDQRQVSYRAVVDIANERSVKYNEVVVGDEPLAKTIDPTLCKAEK